MRTLALILTLSSIAVGQMDLTRGPNADADSDSSSTVLVAKADVSPADPGSPALLPLAYQPTLPAAPARAEAERRFPTKKLFALAIAQHSAAALDAWSTRRVLSDGGLELNPMLRPFAHSNALYPALQAWPSGMDYLGYRMARSNHRLFQRTWWIPQVASTAVFATFAVHNRAISFR